MEYQEYKITLNAYGFHNPVKRSKRIAKMKRERIEVAFWQKTHLSNPEHEKLKKMGFTTTFYSCHKSGLKRGVVILLWNKLHFQLTAQIKDKEGGYILVKGKTDHKEVTLLNLYMPPGHDLWFIKPGVIRNFNLWGWLEYPIATQTWLNKFTQEEKPKLSINA